MLVHICCSVDSHYFLQKLREKFPNKKLIGFFYNPNIHPYSEYRLRLLDVKRSSKKLGIELIEGEYSLNRWLERVKGFESAKERGERCNLCFDERLEVSSKVAKELNIKEVTTTLLTSPKKSLEKLQESGKRVCQKYERNFLTFDFRSAGGTQRQFELAKRDKLYRQNYCGCLFALSKQREEQGKFADELISPLNGATLLNSIEERERLYEEVIESESKKVKFEVIRERFLNYRLLNASVELRGEVIPSYILSYSTLRKKFSKVKVDFFHNGIYYLNRDEIKFIDINKFNKLSGLNFKSVKELIYTPVEIELEIEIRNRLINSKYDLSTIVVLDRVEIDINYKISLKSKLYEDTKERLLKLK